MDKYKLLFQKKSYIYVHKVIGINNMVFKINSSKHFNEILRFVGVFAHFILCENIS